jgi:hypothetical protein
MSMRVTSGAFDGTTPDEAHLLLSVERGWL